MSVGTAVVGTGACVVLTGVFVGFGRGVQLGYFGDSVVGIGVSEGKYTVVTSVGVSVAVGVMVWLGVMLTPAVAALVAVPVSVTDKAASHGTTPDRPRL